MVKLDKMTGATVWTSKELNDPAGYSSVIAADVGGVRTYITFTASAIVCSAAMVTTSDPLRLMTAATCIQTAPLCGRSPARRPFEGA